MCAHSRSRVQILLLLLLPVVRAGAIGYDVDYATFADLRGDTTRSYVEIYFRVDRWSLTVASVSGSRTFGLLKGTPDTLVVGFTADVAVVTDPGDTLAHERHIVRKPLTEYSSGTAYDDLFTTVGLYLPPGSYSLATVLTDQYSPDTARHVLPLVVQCFSHAKPMLSDIELALSVGRDTTGSRFAKHGLSVLANARRVFGFGAPILYFYTEVYNLDEHADYRLVAAFVDSAGDTTRTLGPFAVLPTGRTSVEVKGVNVMGWVDGRYRLAMSLRDSTNRTIAAQQKEVVVSRVPCITPPTITKFINDVSWIASRSELAEFEQLPPEEKARFIQEFWAKRDPTPGTLLNEAKEEHFRRLAFADQRFGEPGMPGRKSDPGRVYIQYGPPDDVERHASTVEGRPYQIWHYDGIQGGVIFVFVDYAGTGRPTLVHSTARDEVHNEQWRQIVEPFEGTLQRRERINEEMRGRAR